MIHSEHGFIHIPHPHRMNKLAHAQHGKRMGLCLIEQFRQSQHGFHVMQVNRKPLSCKCSIRNLQECGQADRRDHSTIAKGTRQPSVGKKIFVAFSRLLPHQLAAVVFIHP